VRFRICSLANPAAQYVDAVANMSAS
jgi:hypothetical protein